MDGVGNCLSGFVDMVLVLFIFGNRLCGGITTTGFARMALVGQFGVGSRCWVWEGMVVAAYILKWRWNSDQVSTKNSLRTL